LILTRSLAKTKKKVVDTKPKASRVKKTSKRKNKRALYEPEEPTQVRIKAIRKTLRLKKVELAKRLGFTASTIVALENGNIRPGYDFCIRIYHKLNVNLYYLLFGLGPMFINNKIKSILFEQKSSDIGKDEAQFLKLFEKSPYFKYNMLIYCHNFLLDEKNIEEIKLDLEMFPILEEYFNKT